MLKTFLRWLTSRQRATCEHRRAAADILEGDITGESVSWCYDCGAVRRNTQNWRAFP